MCIICLGNVHFSFKQDIYREYAILQLTLWFQCLDGFPIFSELVMHDISCTLQTKKCIHNNLYARIIYKKILHDYTLVYFSQSKNGSSK